MWSRSPFLGLDVVSRPINGLRPRSRLGRIRKRLGLGLGLGLEIERLGPDIGLAQLGLVQISGISVFGAVFMGRYWDDDVGRLLNDPLHRVCVVDWSEKMHEVHGSMPGAGPSTVCYPIHLATLSGGDDDGDPGTCYLLVADSDNDRVKLLGDRLDYICDLLRPTDGLCGPYRLSVDKSQTLLAVGCVDGRVFVYRICDLLPASVELFSHS